MRSHYKSLLLAIDGEPIKFLAHTSGLEFETFDPAIQNIQVMTCMRALQAESHQSSDDEPIIDLTVDLDGNRMSWEDASSAWQFFNLDLRKPDAVDIIIQLSSANKLRGDDLLNIIKPVLAGSSYLIKDTQSADEASYSESHTWEIKLSCASEDVTFSDVSDMRKKLSQLTFLPSRKITSPDMAWQMLQFGLTDIFVGHHESEWLEAKSAPYDLKNVSSQAWKLELAKDVSQFANSQLGGLLALGFHTRRKDGGDIIDKITPFPYDEKRIQSYRDILRHKIHPPIAGLEIDAARDDLLCVVYIYVPPQPDENKPYLVTGSMIDGEFESLGITIVRRHGDASIPVTAHELHAMIAAGKAFLRGQHGADH